jgi:hypothetical protein
VCAASTLVRRKLWQNWWNRAKNFHFFDTPIANLMAVARPEANFFNPSRNKGDLGIVHTRSG